MKLLCVLAFLVGVTMATVVVLLCLIFGPTTFFNVEERYFFGEFVASTLGAGVAVTAGFMFVGVCGDRIVHLLRYRIVAGALLSIPVLAFGTLLLFGNHPEIEPVFVPLFAFSILLFSAFIWPAWLKRANTTVNEGAPIAARLLPRR